MIRNRNMEDRPDLEEIRGALRAVRYQQRGFLIGTLADGTTVKGDMPSPQIGLEYAFRGRWEDHPQWGRQFAFAEYRSSYPTDLEAVRGYLMENCKWIGPEISKRLVEAYGKDTLEICKKEPERVAKEIQGLTAKRALEVSAMLRGNEADEELQLQLKELLGGTRVHRRAVARIVELWGQEAPKRIRENPYAMIQEVEGVGFLTADEVAIRVGYDREGGPRLKAGLLHTLSEQAFSAGHSCLPAGALLEAAARLLGTGRDLIAAEIPALEKDGLVVCEAGSVYLKAMHEDETLIARQIRRLLSKGGPAGQPQYEGLQADQREAMAKAVTSAVFILTGAPGTGKTFTIKRILDSFPGAKVALAAPTGKAAKRIIEQTGRPAVTMHKLLEPTTKNGERFEFSRDAENPLKADLIVLDEVSMVDTWLMARFLEAVEPGTRLVLVGDTYQLPSVGPGNILKDLIASGIVPFTELTIIKRQDEGLIIRNCHRIKNGEDVELGNSTAKDFFFLKRSEEDGIREELFQLVSKRLPETYKAHPLRDIQVITPLREKTGLSCAALNAEFQKRLNANPLEEGCRFKVGDKVIQTKNKYALELINGDIGYVLDVQPKARSMTVAFESPDRTVELTLNDNDLELAYAITCHKFQGSENRIIVVPISRSFGPLIMQRNWLYTAVSRAKEVCVLVGQRDEIPRIIRRNQQQKRFTRLAELLGGPRE